MSALAQTNKAEEIRRKRRMIAWRNTVRKEGEESVYLIGATFEMNTYYVPCH